MRFPKIKKEAPAPKATPKADTKAAPKAAPEPDGIDALAAGQPQPCVVIRCVDANRATEEIRAAAASDAASILAVGMTDAHCSWLAADIGLRVAPSPAPDIAALLLRRT